jgi:hypothetical protein
MIKLTKVKPVKKINNQKGFVLYSGASVLDGEPIVCIATLSTSNKKTGQMIQTWIIRSDMNPLEASKTKQDSSVCGNCVHRRNNNGACYVNLGQAPLAIYKSYVNNLYPVFNIHEHSDYFIGRKIRLGAYGDPAAVPFNIWKQITDLCSGHTGYTHQIKHKRFDNNIISLCMVSADSPKQALKYQAMGAKTFRVAMQDDYLFDNEIECLADSKGIQCIDCGLCDGKSANVAIAVHGSLASRFKTSLIQTVTI